jgi:hypothetical protein
MTARLSALRAGRPLPSRKIPGINFCCLLICCRGKVFTETLSSNERLLWFHYFGFRASCHNILSPGQDLNPSSVEYEGVLPAIHRCFFKRLQFVFHLQVKVDERVQARSFVTNQTLDIHEPNVCTRYSVQERIEGLCPYNRVHCWSHKHFRTTRPDSCICADFFFRDNTAKS